LRICVDTTILLDILKDEFRSFQDKFYTALARRENLVSPSVVYAELMPQFKGDTKLLNEFLEEHKIIIEPLDVDSVIAAAEAWMEIFETKKKSKMSSVWPKAKSQKAFLVGFSCWRVRFCEMRCYSYQR